MANIFSEETSKHKIMMGEMMKLRRKYLGMTQQEVADAMDIDRVTYTQYEVGKNQIPSADLPRLAKLFRLESVAFFFDEVRYEEVEDADAMRYYKGLPPLMKSVARQQLKALFDAQDAEAKELEPTTHGRKAE